MLHTDSIEMRINGLHSGTILKTKDIAGGVREEWHEHPETGEVVVVHTQAVPDGDCVSFESSVVAVYPKQKGMVDCIKGMEVLIKTIEKFNV